MDKYIDKISSLENLMLAWMKLEKAFNRGDVWYDELIISAFKMNLVENLTNINKELIEGRYRMTPIQPIPFPKGGKDADGNLKVRQSFFIDFKDQLVWVAVCNVIGRTFDVMMPGWSYGNRQYITTWKEAKEGKSAWILGNHRNTAGLIYRKWTQSWPLMRKRITASLKKMARLRKEDLDKVDTQVYEDEDQLKDEQFFYKLKYLEPGYFCSDADEEPLERLYWTGIDLTQFYQKIKMEKIKNKIISVLKSKPSFDDRFSNLLDVITSFDIDYSDYGYDGAENDLKSMQLSKDVPFEGLPTGLVVAGMLANIFMIDIDSEVSKRLDNEKDIIHFRYVDDHVIISTSEKKLFDWICWYKKLLTENGLELNKEKLAPEGLREGLQENFVIEDNEEAFINNIRLYAGINPKYPTPLMTQTLQKVSMLQGLNLNMLSQREYQMVFEELQSLLVADLSEQEIKESTRISFACTMLTRLIVNNDVDYEKIYYLRRMWMNEVKKLKKQLKDKNNKTQIIDDAIETCENIIFNDAEHIDIEGFKKKYPDLGIDDKYLRGINDTLKEGEQVTKGKERQTFNMLMYALDKVPDKVKVWIRVFNYCLKHEPKNIKLLYEKLDRFKGETLHELSIDFLKALLNTLCAENVIKATARLVLNDYTIAAEEEKEKEFLEYARQIGKSESKHFFVIDSNKLLSKAIAFSNIYEDSLGLKHCDTSEQYFREWPDYHNKRLDSTFWLLWAADLIKTKKNVHKPIFSVILRESLDAAHVESKFFQAFFYAYLREVSVTSGKEMKLPENTSPDIGGWLNDLTKYTICQLPNVKGLKNLVAVEDCEKYNPPQEGDWLNLRQWIDLINNKEKDDTYYELLHSEIMSVLIMLSVIKKIRAQGENKDAIQIHPENFYLNKKEFEFNWSYYISMIEKKELFNVEYIQNPNVDYSPYDYPKYLNKEAKKDISISYGLGIIFLQLLSKKKILPWALYSNRVGFEWQFVLDQLQGQGRVSSLNYRIVSSCLSARQRENQLFVLDSDIKYVPETYRDNPKIQNWEQLEDELKNSLSRLRKNLVSVSNEAHRQLTIIDLD